MLRRKGRPSRFLAAVVFTDIAGSTELAARLGDEGWKRLLERHLRLVRSSLHRFDGDEIDTAGDGLYATFDSPAAAITFALDVAERDKELGIRVRSGIHVGEVELIGGKAGGIAVHIGARIAALAQPGDVLVSATVRDLATGSAFAFEERGTSELKGVPGQWTIYAAAARESPADLPAETRLPIRERISARVRTNRTRVVIGVAALAAIAVTGLGVSALLRTRLLPAVEANSLGRITTADGGIVSAVPVGSIPDAIAFGMGSLWITDTTKNTVGRIDMADSRLVQTIRVGSSPNAVAVGHDAVWVANGNDRTVSRVSPATNEVIATITVGNGPSGVATDAQWVWVTSRLNGTLARIDPSTSEVTPFSIGSTPTGVAAGAGSVWVSDFDTGTVIRVDPSTGASRARIHVGNGPTSIAATDDQVWVVNSRDGTVSRIDPTSDTVVATIPVGAEPGAVAMDRSVWVTVGASADIVRIDAGTNGIAQRFPVGSRPRGIAVDGGDAWFTTRAATSNHLGGTVAIIGQDADSVPYTLDPADGFEAVYGLVQMFLTNDGLVGFKRVGGSDGLTLVPDLALAIPTPTDGGRTYTFRLRSGIVYSDGTPLRPADVRASVERVLIIAPDAMDVIGSNLEGAAACPNAPTTCDLSSSVVVDDAAGTVTFHLNAPDPEFLYKLALPGLVVLPESTPREAVTTPLPATGPYMPEPFDADGGLRLVRNPLFKEWSHEAQPAGYADEITWRIASADEDVLALVGSGQADTTYSTASVSADQINAFRTQHSDQLHVLAPSQTWFEFMNTTMAPFDQVDVRRAVNLATDRRQVVELFGGEFSGRPTCQAAPPGFPGYDPICPYTVPPLGVWRSPDVAAARDLIERAGVKGTAVTVWAIEEFPRHVAIGEYFEGLLDDLGFDASLKMLTFEELGQLGEHAATAELQMIGFWTGSIYPSPMMNVGTFTCPGFSLAPISYNNFAAFCDPEIDALALHASALQATDPAAANLEWAEVDRLIVEQSPAVAAFNPIDFAFVSGRAGNVQVHPVLGVLLAQMWVQ